MAHAAQALEGVAAVMMDSQVAELEEKQHHDPQPWAKMILACFYVVVFVVLRMLTEAHWTLTVLHYNRHLGACASTAAAVQKHCPD